MPWLHRVDFSVVDRLLRSSLLAGATTAACSVGQALPRAALADDSDLIATLEADRPRVVQAASEVLATWGFKIATADVERGVVETADLRVRGSWMGAVVSDYLYCGGRTESRDEETEPDAVTVKARVAMRQQDLGATLLRITVTGALVTSDGDTHRCRPTSRMASELMDGIRARVSRSSPAGRPLELVPR